MLAVIITDDKLKLEWSNHCRGTHKWCLVALEDLASDTSLHH